MGTTAEIVFEIGQNPQKFQFQLTASGNPWRYLTDETAVVLAPLCDALARPVSVPPLFDRLEIWPCRWGCPDFSQTNPTEYANLKRRFLAGKYPPDSIPMPPPDQLERYWPSFLKQRGNQILWEQCVNDEMKRHWINNLEEFTDCGFMLFMLAQESPHQLRGPEPTIVIQDLENIRFQAKVYNGEKCQTIYLADCKTGLLTVDEKRLSPRFIAQEGKRLRDQRKLVLTEKENFARRQKLAAVEANFAKKQAAKVSRKLPWHTEGFGIIYRLNRKGEKVGELTLTPVFQALCQILSEQPEQRAWFSKIEPLIGPRAQKIDAERGTMAESPSSRRIRDLLKERQGKNLQKWKVLVIEAAGQRKLIKLSSSK
jgi:hypothetical protein